MALLLLLTVTKAYLTLLLLLLDIVVICAYTVKLQHSVASIGECVRGTDVYINITHGWWRW